MTRTLRACLLVLTGLAAGTPAHAAAHAAAVVSEVQAALDKGDAQQALSFSDAALNDGGIGAAERGRLLLYHGLAQELLGAHGDAMGDFTRALETHALSVEEREQALLQRGFLRDGLGTVDGALADYTAVIALQGANLATAYNNRGNIYRRQNRLIEARRDYQAALAARGNKPQYSWYGLGQIAEAQHQIEAARGFYARAVAADAGYALASERLTALGGAPDAAVADAVVLRPPHAQPSGWTPAPPMPADTVTATPISAVQAVSSASLPPPVQPPARMQPVAQVHPHKTATSSLLRPALDTPRLETAGARIEVQLGAWRSQAEAEAGWAKARAQAKDLLGALKPHIVVADLPGKGRYYRLRVPAASGLGQAAFCASLDAQGVSCIPARN